MPQEIRLLGFLLIAALSLGVFFRRGSQILGFLRLGQPHHFIPSIKERLRTLLVYIIEHKQMFRFTWSGVLHLFIFYGFVILLSFILQSIGEAFFGLGWQLPLIGGSPLLTLPQDIIALLVLVGVAMAFYQRLARHPHRFEGSDESDAYIILSLIATIVTTTLLVSASERALEITRHPAWATPVATALASLLQNLPVSNQRGLLEVVWWLHIIAVFSFLPYLLYSKHMHVLIGIPNVFLRDLTPAGAIELLNLDDPEAERFGIGRVEDFSWKHMLDFYACTECGRCMSVCPATMAGTTLNPKLLIMDLRAHLDKVGPELVAQQQTNSQSGAAGQRSEELAGGAILESTLWSCTTCRACVYECPLFIEHVDDIIDMRRYLVLTEARFPDQLAQAFNQAERAGNPWGQSPSSRLDWAQGLDVPLMAAKKEVDVLYWIGCAGAYDPNSMRTSRAMVKILQAAGVDFAVLGEEERCNCEWARRAGNEYLYQESTKTNIESWSRYKFNTIVTHCPHCFNTFRNEYPQFGGNYEVVHHSQFISKLIAEGRLKPQKARAETITYHDSCYLGRYNNVYESPRESLHAIPGVNLIEMSRSRDKGLCCGGGGAHAWFEDKTQKHPVNEIRLEEAMALKPNTVATACPFCTLMLDSAAQTKGVTDQVKIRDFAELVAEALE